MILLSKLVIALLAALGVGGIFRWLVRPAGPWPRFWSVFLLLFLSIAAAGVWLTPMEPIEWGPSILIFAGLGCLAALTLLVIGYPLRIPKRREPHTHPREAAMIETAFQLPFWILVVMLVFTIALRYLS